MKSPESKNHASQFMSRYDLGVNWTSINCIRNLTFEGPQKGTMMLNGAKPRTSTSLSHSLMKRFTYLQILLTWPSLFSATTLWCLLLSMSCPWWFYQLRSKEMVYDREYFYHRHHYSFKSGFEACQLFVYQWYIPNTFCF